MGIHCVKSVQMRSFFWSVFSRIRTEFRKTWTIHGAFSVLTGHWAEFSELVRAFEGLLGYTFRASESVRLTFAEGFY